MTQEDVKEEIVLEFNPNGLKEILLHSQNYKKKDFVVNVAPSRFRRILNDYFGVIMGITVENAIDYYCEHYDYYIITELDKTGNVYKVIKDARIKEYRGKCSNCNCSNKKGRWINGETGICYYNEMINKDYTTKIN